MKTNLKISFEFFPPKNLKMSQNLWNTLNKLKIFYPDFGKEHMIQLKNLLIDLQ